MLSAPRTVERRWATMIVVLCLVSSESALWMSASLSASTLTKIAAYFGVSVDYLLGEEKPKEKLTTEYDVKVALFGGAEEVTDEMWAEVKTFVEFVKQKNGIR